MSHDHFCTPDIVVDMLEQFHGGPVGLDPCSNAHSRIRALRAYVAGSLWLPWDPPEARAEDGSVSIYENSPYSNIEAFTDHGVRQFVKPGSRIREWTRLLPASVSTAWFRKSAGQDPVFDGGGKVELYLPPPTVVFTKRLAFRDPFGIAKDGARFDTTLFYSGPRRRAFLREFKSITSWVASGRPGRKAA